MTTYNTIDRPAAPPAFSIPSILAIIAAILSFTVGAGAQFLLAIAAAVLGVIGVALALLPHRRGGIISLLSIGLGALALLIAIIRMIASIG